MTLAAVAQDIERDRARCRIRTALVGHLRALLVRSDNLLDEAECTNRDGLPVRETFEAALAALLADIDPGAEMPRLHRRTRRGEPQSELPDAELAVDAVFAVQGALFRLLRRGRIFPEDDEDVTAASIADWRHACCWLERLPDGRIRADELPSWLEQMIDRLHTLRLVRQWDVRTWSAAVAWREVLGDLEREVDGG